jgi:hypothetical protein
MCASSSFETLATLALRMRIGAPLAIPPHPEEGA